MNFGKAHKLCLDFLKNFIYDFYFDATKNKIITNFNDEFSKEAISLY